MEARSRSEERQLHEENKTPEEAVKIPKKDLGHLEGKGRTEEEQLRHWKETLAAAASNNDLKARSGSRSLNPVANAKLAEVIPQKKMKSDGIMQMKKEKNVEGKADINARIEAQINHEADAVKAAKVGEKTAQKLQAKKQTCPTEDMCSSVLPPAQKLEEKKRAHSTKDIHSSVKVKKQKV